LPKNRSDYLVKILVEAGLKSIYEITGDSLSLVNDAALRDGR
jgi:hypothetical protein